MHIGGIGRDADHRRLQQPGHKLLMPQSTKGICRLSHRLRDSRLFIPTQFGL